MHDSPIRSLGKEVALFVEKYFVKELQANSSFKAGDYEKALIETFLRMDQLINTTEGRKELLFLKKSGGEGAGGDFDGDLHAGCTACVALMAKGELIVANAGDSRCVLSRRGKAIEMSEDHKPENEKERERIEKAGGYIVEGRVNGNLNLSRALGDLEFKQNAGLKPHEQLISAMPEIKKTKLTEDDEFIVLGCDGIWECMSNQGIVDFIGKRLKNVTPTSKVIEELLDKIVAPETASTVIL